jgi:hypothetical protein
MQAGGIREKCKRTSGCALGNPGMTTIRTGSEQDGNLSNEDNQQDGDNNIGDRVTDFEAEKFLGLLIVVIKAHYSNSPGGRKRAYFDTGCRRFAISMLVSWRVFYIEFIALRKKSRKRMGG